MQSPTKPYSSPLGSVFLNARLPPAARAVSPTNSVGSRYQGRAFGQVASDSEPRKEEKDEKVGQDGEGFALSEEGRVVNPQLPQGQSWRRFENQYPPVKVSSSAHNDGTQSTPSRIRPPPPQLYDLSQPNPIPFSSSNNTDLDLGPQYVQYASRRNTLEEEGSDMGSPRREGTVITIGNSTDRLVDLSGFLSTNKAGRERQEESDHTRVARDVFDNETRRENGPRYPPTILSDKQQPGLFDLTLPGRTSTTQHPLTPMTTSSPTRPSGSYHDSTQTGPYRRKTRTPKYKHLNSLPLSSTRYFLGGKLLTGGDSYWPLIGSIVLVLGMSGLWLGTTGIWVWREGLGTNGGRGGIGVTIVFAYLVGVVVSSMIATAFRDPGILPRNLDLTYPIAYTSSTGTLVPQTREMRIKGGSITVKYCETCKLYRPPRSSHCRLCGNCVEGIDHHCSYLHNCVGKRNYTSFITFLTSAVVAVIYIVTFSAIHFKLLTTRQSISFRQALSDSPGSAVAFSIGVLVVWPLLALWGYHLRLMFLNSTTIEQIRKSASRGLVPTGGAPSTNPFSYHSFHANFIHALCRPLNPSWVDASGYEVDDHRLINPGVVKAYEKDRRNRGSGL